MAENITTLCANAAALLLSFPSSTLVRVVSHYDADGITAAGVLCTAIYRAGYDFHCSLMRNPFTKGFERLKQEHNDIIIFADMGSGQMEEIEQLGCSAIILDHHQSLTSHSSKKVIQINANLCGIDGNYEVSGATLSYLFATAVSPNNDDLCALALAGATGDKQYIGGMRGVNLEILKHALEKGFLKEQIRIKLCGETLADALYYTIDPYYRGFSGKKEEIEKTLEKLQVKPETNVENLDPETSLRVQSLLLFKLLQVGCQQNILDIAIRKRYYATSFGWELERFADLLDACGKFGHRSLGLALCFNNQDAWNEAINIEKQYKQHILDALQELEKGGMKETEGMRYFYSESSSLGGVIAGIAINYLVDEKKPLFALTRKEEEQEIHVSCRGNQMLVQHGLDLGVAMKDISTELGGYGGGHKIAAGATIGLQKEQEFLEKVNTVVIKQMRNKA